MADPDSETVSESLQRHKETIDSAVTHGDKLLLHIIKQQLESLTGRENYGYLAKYYLAYTNYRLISLFNDMGKEKKERLLNESISILESVVEQKPGFAEAWALLGNCYGMKANGVFSAMKYGPKSEKAIDKALQLEPNNPRANMIYAVSLMYKPGMFGGSVDKAISRFRQAGELYNTWQPESKITPEWGHAENYAWLAEAYLEQGNRQQARDCYRQALEVDPDYYWVKEILLPELDRKM